MVKAGGVSAAAEAKKNVADLLERLENLRD
jgi:hypothetical protein